MVRYTDLKAGPRSCRRCAALATGAVLAERAQDPTVLAELRARAKRGNAVAVAATRKWEAYQRTVVTRMASAKQRCQNPRAASYENYGGRGIEFRFDSIAEAVEYVIAHLGYPAVGQTLDRKDNEGHYERGNLRWASRVTQANNKRAYKNTLTGLPEARAARPDLSESLLRSLIKQGKTTEQIKGWVKYASSRV